MTAVMVAILLALGIWQVHRLAWKERLLAEIAAAERAPAIPLPPHPGPFVKVSVSGRFRPDLAVHFGDIVRDTMRGPAMGADLVVPLERADGPPVLVDRGWVPLSFQAPIAWPGPGPHGTVTVDGYVAAAQHPGLFTPRPEPRGRQVYALDPAMIGRMVGLREVAPFTLIALGTQRLSHYPVPADRLPRPPNHHLVYLTIWFTLAGALVVIFTVWARDLLRGEAPAPRRSGGGR
ncbi:MAG: SURF1 family protein [Rhodospirillales bacterium]|jgi:surfeit locus 1 family protein|nr:SURF1 family protein [Rhodospirillales bacterium]